MKLKSPEEYGYVVKNNICLFQSGPLSQWWGGFNGQESRFSPRGEPFLTSCDDVFTSAEQWMMSAKAVIMGDMDAMDAIHGERHPKKIKELGRTIKGYDQVLWDKHKRKVVYWGNLWKFSQNQQLKDFLLSFPRHIIFAEAAPWDPIWGIGLDVNNPDALDIYKWQGQNLLGEAIQRVHRELY